MLEGRTSDCLALANTVILMRLVEELIKSGVITRSVAGTVMNDAVDSLVNGPNGAQQFRGCRHHHPQGTDAESCGLRRC